MIHDEFGACQPMWFPRHAVEPRFDPKLSERPEVQKAAQLANAFKDHMVEHNMESATVNGVRIVA